MLSSVGLLSQHPSVQAGPNPPVASAPTPIQNDPNIFVELARKTVPSVVNISTLSTPKGPRGGPRPEDLFREFFGQIPRNRQPIPPWAQKRQLRPRSLGTGFVIDSKGIILTNNHVIEGADEVRVTFTESPDEKPTPAEIVGRDPDLDIALLKVRTDRALVPLPLGDSEALHVGEYVAAVGNPFGQGHSFSHGIISAKGRPAPDFPLASYLQTDAPINPGNSGGPLINLKGEVIGINNAIDARAQGIGFAIPINVVKSILPQLQSKGTVARGYLGAMISSLTPEIAKQVGAKEDSRSPIITQIEPDGPADRAGLKPYDLILAVDGKEVKGPEDLTGRIAAYPAGESVPVKISREGKTHEVTVKLGQRPDFRELARSG